MDRSQLACLLRWPTRPAGHLDTFRLFQTLTQRITALYGGMAGAAQQPPAAGVRGGLARRCWSRAAAGARTARLGVLLLVVLTLRCSVGLPARLPAGTLPTFAAWQAGCKENAEGTTTLHDVWGMMLGALPCECWAVAGMRAEQLRFIACLGRALP